MSSYGLIGHPLGHSLSPRIHALLGTPDYALWDVPPGALDDFLRRREFLGANVTSPYKREACARCDAWSDAARRIGSVNTLLRLPDGRLYGDTTDLFGFEAMARRAGASFAGEKTLVLGSGGAGRTVCDAVRAQGGVPVTISRAGPNDYRTIERHADAAILVNATPVGMYPDVDASPVELTRLPALRLVLDLIYNPPQTRLLRQAQALGIPCENGLYMLCAQAARSHALFEGGAHGASAADENAANRLYHRLLSEGAR